MKLAKGDVVRMRVDGDRRPPLQGVVVDVHGGDGPDHRGLVIAVRSDDGRIAYLAPGNDTEAAARV